MAPALIFDPGQHGLPTPDLVVHATSCPSQPKAPAACDVEPPEDGSPAFQSPTAVPPALPPIIVLPQRPASAAAAGHLAQRTGSFPLRKSRLARPVQVSNLATGPAPILTSTWDAPGSWDASGRALHCSPTLLRSCSWDAGAGPGPHTRLQTELSRHSSLATRFALRSPSPSTTLEGLAPAMLQTLLLDPSRSTTMKSAMSPFTAIEPLSGSRAASPGPGAPAYANCLTVLDVQVSVLLNTSVLFNTSATRSIFKVSDWKPNLSEPLGDDTRARF